MRGRQYRRTPTFRRIRNEANRLLSVRIRRKELPRAADAGPCCDCGGVVGLQYDHRNYSDPMRVEIVCAACNQKRGPAVVWMLDVERMRWSMLPHSAPSQEAAA
jgi:hypothetical protein